MLTNLKKDVHVLAATHPYIWHEAAITMVQGRRQRRRTEPASRKKTFAFTFSTKRRVAVSDRVLTSSLMFLSAACCLVRLPVGHSERGGADNAVERRLPHGVGQPTAVTGADAKHRPLAVLAHPCRRHQPPAHAAGDTRHHHSL